MRSERPQALNTVVKDFPPISRMNPSVAEESILETDAPIANEPPISIDRARRYFLESTQATATNDGECRIDADYYHDKQLSAAVKQKLQQRGQPPIWINKIKPAILGIFGIIDAAQTDPQCFPRDPAQQATADLATKILRYLNDAADMESVRATLSKDFFIYGTCAAVVCDAAYEGCDSLGVKPIHWEDFFGDPLSRDHDFADARYMGIRKWFDADEIAQLYPDTYSELGSPFESAGDGWFDSKGAIDDETFWIDRQRKRIRVIELYYRDDDFEWQRVVYCEKGFLDFGPSVYKNDKGKTICPIIAASYEVNRQTGDRYGPIRSMRPIQDEVNSRRSKLINETNNRRIQQTVEGIDPKSKDIAKREAPKADGVLPYGWTMVAAPDIVEGQFMLLQQSQADLDRLAPTPAVLGRMQGSDSGKARQLLQQAGYTEWARSFSFLTRMEETINRHLWFGAKQFMTAPQWIRYSGEATAPEFIQVNVPVGIKMVPEIDPQTGQPAIDPQTGMPMMKQEVIKERALSEMDVDIILDTVPQSSSLEHETTQEILRYAGSTGISPLDPSFKAILMMFPLPNKTKTLEQWDSIRATLMQEQAAQMQQQQQQMEQQQQLQAMQIQAKAAKDAAQAQKAEADAAKTRSETFQALMPQPLQMPQEMPQQLPPQFPPPGF